MSNSQRPVITRLRAGAIAAMTATVVLGATVVPRAEAAAAKAGGTCPIRSIGTVTNDAKGMPLVCTKISKAKYQWKLLALGSFQRPVPLGQAGPAGPADNRFSVRVTRVNLDATAELVAESPEAVPPAADVRYVRVVVEAAFLGPATSGSTGHYWYARAADGGTYAASQGCGGGYGTTFDVTTVVPIGGVVAGTHCFEVPAANVESLRLRVEGAGLPDTFFALR